MSKEKIEVVISYILFERRMLGDLDEFIKDLKTISDSKKKAINSREYGEHTRFYDTHGTKFVFSLDSDSSENDAHSLIIWGDDGYRTLFEGAVPNGEKRKEFVDKVLAVCEEYSNGKIHCSHCGSLESLEEIKYNRFWAGTYCEKCWQREYKAKEAKENYN